MEKLQTIIFLVRHGETDFNYSRDRSADGERLLTKRGHKQAERLGEFFSQFQPSAIYSSPMKRCQDTAQAIANKIGLPIEKIAITTKLSEIYSPIDEVRTEAGERGETIFKTILHEHAGEQVVAVTHQFIIGYIVADFWRVDYQQVPCDFADVYRLVFAGDKLFEAMRLSPAATTA